MTMIDQVASAMHDVLTTIAQRLGRETGFVQRESKLGGAACVETLVFTYLANPNATLDELTQTAAALDVEISAPGLQQRFTPAAATFLQQVVAAAVTRVLAAGAIDLPILTQFAGVFVEDSTTIVLPDALRALWSGCGSGTGQGEAALKIMLRLDLVTGLISGLSLHDGRRNDSAAAHASSDLPPGALYLADSGFFSLTRFARLSAAQVFVLTRFKPGTALVTADGQRWDDLVALLESQDGPTIDPPVQVGAHARVPMRLVAVRAPQEVVDQRRRRLRESARKHGRMVSDALLALAAWTVFLTTVPVGQLPVAAVLVVARARWQIEVWHKTFKKWLSNRSTAIGDSGAINALPGAVCGDRVADCLHDDAGAGGARRAVYGDLGYGRVGSAIRAD